MIEERLSACRRSLVAVCLIAAVFEAAGAAASVHCPPYPTAPEYRARQSTLSADPSNWIQVIEGARNGDEILLVDGTYRLDEYTVQIDTSVTIRGASGNRDAVVIVGEGYDVPAEGFMVMAENVTIADLTMRDIRLHAISVKGELGADAPQIYNVHLLDIGTQHIKGTADTLDGLIACSKIGYSEGAVAGDYIDGIDLHGAIGWTIRDNHLYNIWGDGTGCEVDIDCGRYLSGGGPAIQLWRGSRDNVVERNRIVDSFRGIAIGFGTDHPGGVVRNNFFYQSEPGRPGARGFIPGDMGIAIYGGSDTLVEHNTVLLGGDYRGAIEIRDSVDVIIRNNLIDRPIWDRGSATFVAVGNKIDAVIQDFAAPGDPHLVPSSSAVDFAQAVSWSGLPGDIDGQVRPEGTGPDPGCDELGGGGEIFVDGFESGGLGAWSG
jgi:hypothetical protein